MHHASSGFSGIDVCFFDSFFESGKMQDEPFGLPPLALPSIFTQDAFSFELPPVPSLPAFSFGEVQPELSNDQLQPSSSNTNRKRKLPNEWSAEALSEIQKNQIAYYIPQLAVETPPSPTNISSSGQSDNDDTGKRDKHRQADRDRRARIKDGIEALKKLLPDLSGRSDQASIVSASADHIVDLRNEIESLKSQLERASLTRLQPSHPQPHTNAELGIVVGAYTSIVCLLVYSGQAHSSRCSGCITHCG